MLEGIRNLPALAGLIFAALALGAARRRRWFAGLLTAGALAALAPVACGQCPLRSNVCGLRQHVAPLKVAAVQHHGQAVVAKVVDYGHHAQALAVVAHDDYAYRYCVGQGIRDGAIAELAAQKALEAQRAEFEALIAKLKAGESAGEAPPLPVDPGSPMAAMQTLFDRSCVSCHDGSDEKRIDLRDATALSDGQLVGVYRQVYSGKMPKNAEPLGDAEMAVIAHALGTDP